MSFWDFLNPTKEQAMPIEARPNTPVMAKVYDLAVARNAKEARATKGPPPSPGGEGLQEIQIFVVRYPDTVVFSVPDKFSLELSLEAAHSIGEDMIAAANFSAPGA